MARRQQNVCRDFQKGNCRFGAQCRFSHDVGQTGGGRNQKNVFGSNPFGALASGAKTPGPPGKAPEKVEHRCESARVCQDQIRDDFQNEKPTWWSLTAYTHWKYLPNDVSGDVSFEELRWEAYAAVRTGAPLQQVVAREQQLIRNKEFELQQLLLNPYPGPGQTQIQPQTPLLFGKPVSASTSAATSPFGQPATSAATSPFGQSATSVATSPFEQPATSAATSPFGQSAFGQPGAFGSPPQAFGTQLNSPFGQTQNLTQTLNSTQSQATVFGKPAAQTGFGGNIFGVKPVVPASPFGVSTSPFGNQTLNTPQTAGQTGFGTPQTVSQIGFGTPNLSTPQPSAQTPFGGGTIFGRAANPVSANPVSVTPSGFGGLGPQTPAQNIFGRAPSGAAPSPFGAQPRGGQSGAQSAPPFGNGTANAFGVSPFGSANGLDLNGTNGGDKPAASTKAPPPSDPGGDPNRDVWLADKFEIGKIPEEEPPLYAR